MRVVITKCETLTTSIVQENGHGILMTECQFVATSQLQINSCEPILVFFLNLFDGNIIGIYPSILLLI